MVHLADPASSDPNRSLVQKPFVIDDRDLPWHDAVVARFEHLCRLPSGWDGYDAGPIDFATANFALRLLHSVCLPSTPAPSIVPGVEGDLQIEWHTSEWDIEVHVRAPNLVEAWRMRADRRDVEGDSFKTTIDFAFLHSWLRSLAEPTRADSATATR